MAEDNVAHVESTALRRGTWIGLLVGAGIAAYWTYRILEFAHRPIPAEDAGLYAIFATVYVGFCLVMFPVVVLMGALVGRCSVAAFLWFRKRSKRESLD